MLTSVRLTNFRSFRDSQPLPLRPLTLLLGPNSSGKSSVLRALSLVRQTVAARDPSTPLVLNGAYVNLGSYHDVAFGHDIKLPMHISFSFSTRSTQLERAIGLTRQLQESAGLVAREINVSAEFGYFARPTRIFLRRTEITLDPLNLRFELRGGVGGKFEATIRKDGVEEKPVRVVPIKFYGITRWPAMRWTSSAVDDPRLAWISIRNQLERTFESLLHLGPLRVGPERTYVVSGEAPSDVGAAGEQAIHALWSASRKASTRPVYRHVNEWLRKLGMAAELRFKRISPTQFTVEVKDATTGVITSLADVGFGVSQILPALVQLQLMTDDATLMIEQPEIHLHPQLQTELADVLIESVLTGRQVIAETHSELLLSRLQRRMAEGQIDSRQVAVLYFEMTPSGTAVRQLEFDEFGNFKEPLPFGFFSEEFTERSEQAKAEGRRRKNQIAEGTVPSPVS